MREARFFFFGFCCSTCFLGRFFGRNGTHTHTSVFKEGFEPIFLVIGINLFVGEVVLKHTYSIASL